MDVSFDNVLHWANRMADRKKGNEGKLTRFEEMIENTEDFGTIFEVVKGLKRRMLEILQDNLSKEIKKARRLVNRRIGRVMRAMNNRLSINMENRKIPSFQKGFFVNTKFENEK